MAGFKKTPILVAVFTSFSIFATAGGSQPPAPANPKPGPNEPVTPVTPPEPGIGPQVLDLKTLSGVRFGGQETERFKAPCFLEVAPISRDFGGRLIQDYRVDVKKPGPDAKPVWEKVFRLRGPNHFRTPIDSRASSTVLVYEIDIEEAQLRLVRRMDPEPRISGFDVAIRGSITAVPRREFSCSELKIL
jgi:hypothetical protein